jgi:Leucine-rich repeat (LRR) protein
VTEFSLRGTQVTDAGLKHLSPLENLKSLDLGDTRVAGLKQLPRFATLTDLSLSDSPVTDAALTALAAVPNLSVLSLSGTWITDAGLDHLPALPNLSELHLDGTRITDVGLQSLRRFPQLSELALAKTRVSSAGIKELGLLKNLEVLDVRDTGVSEDALVHLAPLRKLNHLRHSFPITDRYLRVLREMELLHCTPITGRSGDDRPRLMDQVTTVRLYDREPKVEITDVGFMELAAFKNLEHVFMEGTRITERGVLELGKVLPQCKVFRH